MTFDELVRANTLIIKEIFGDAPLEIDPKNGGSVAIKTKWMELHLYFDVRDRFVSSTIKPLLVPAEMSEEHTSDTLLRFLGIDVGERRKSSLDQQQIIDELNRVRPLVHRLQDETTSRDATWFVRGYDEAYTDYCNGKW